MKDGINEVDCKEVIFSGHAVQRMFERGIDQKYVLSALRMGEVIEAYPDDIPYPSVLLLWESGAVPLHIVAAMDGNTRRCIVITVYVPGSEIWEPGYRRRRKP